jgi:HlyD family secretion protein
LKKTLCFMLLIPAIVFMGCRRAGREVDRETFRVVLEDFEVWTPFQGVLDSVQSESVASSISQPAALLMLAPEGALVQEGDVVAVFDTSSLEAGLATLERDLVLAETEALALLEAEIPLRRSRVNSELREARNALTQEQSIGQRMTELAEQGLISPGELSAYESRVQTLEDTVAGLQNQIRLNEEILFPSQIRQSEAREENARRQLAIVREQVAGGRVTAGQSGRVVYPPLHIGGEFRTAREGDTVFRNQEFMRISNMEQLVVRCEVPESRLSRVPPGAPVRAVPDAFPDLVLEGQVLSISSVAIQPAGRPSHMRTFTVNLLLNETDPRLRTGMNFRAFILSEQHAQVPVVPRAFVRFTDGEARVWLQGEGPRTVSIGGGNETHFRIGEGLEPGTVLVRPPEE